MPRRAGACKMSRPQAGLRNAPLGRPGPKRPDLTNPVRPPASRAPGALPLGTALGRAGLSRRGAQLQTRRGRPRCPAWAAQASRAGRPQEAGAAKRQPGPEVPAPVVPEDRTRQAAAPGPRLWLRGLGRLALRKEAAPRLPARAMVRCGQEAALLQPGRARAPGAALRAAPSRGLAVAAPGDKASRAAPQVRAGRGLAVRRPGAARAARSDGRGRARVGRRERASPNSRQAGRERGAGRRPIRTARWKSWRG